MEAQDLEYHQVSRDRSLAHVLAKEGFWSRALETDQKHCQQAPPRDTRAAARSRLMRQIGVDCDDYVIDWDRVRWGDRLADL